MTFKTNCDSSLNAQWDTNVNIGLFLEFRCAPQCQGRINPMNHSMIWKSTKINLNWQMISSLESITYELYKTLQWPTPPMALFNGSHPAKQNAPSFLIESQTFKSRAKHLKMPQNIRISPNFQIQNLTLHSNFKFNTKNLLYNVILNKRLIIKILIM